MLAAVPPTDTILTCSKIATTVSQSHLPVAQATPQMWGLKFHQERGIKEESRCIVSIKIIQKNTSYHLFFLMETTSKSLEFGQLLRSKVRLQLLWMKQAKVLNYYSYKSEQIFLKSSFAPCLSGTYVSNWTFRFEEVKVENKLELIFIKFDISEVACKWRDQQNVWELLFIYRNVPYKKRKMWVKKKLIPFFLIDFHLNLPAGFQCQIVFYRHMYFCSL